MIFYSSQLTAQSEKKHASFVTVGLLGHGFSHEFSLKEQDFKIRLNAMYNRSICLFCEPITPNAYTLGGDLVLFTSQSNHSMDIVLGVLTPIVEDNEVNNGLTFPTIVGRFELGYRFTSSKSIFRVSLGVPDIVSLSFGIRF